MRSYTFYLIALMLLIPMQGVFAGRGGGHGGGYYRGGGYRHGYRGGWGYAYQPYWGWGYPYWGYPYYGFTIGANISTSSSKKVDRAYRQGYEDAQRHAQLETEKQELREENEELRMKLTKQKGMK